MCLHAAAAILRCSPDVWQCRCCHREISVVWFHEFPILKFEFSQFVCFSKNKTFEQLWLAKIVYELNQSYKLENVCKWQLNLSPKFMLSTVVFNFNFWVFRPPLLSIPTGGTYPGPYLNVISESTLCCLTLCMQHDGGAPATAAAAPYRRTSDGSAA